MISDRNGRSERKAKIVRKLPHRIGLSNRKTSKDKSEIGKV